MKKVKKREIIVEIEILDQCNDNGTLQDDLRVRRVPFD